MAEVFRSLAQYEGWVYAVLAIAALMFILRFVRAWDELRRSTFGLERQMAQMRLNQAASVLVLLLLAAIAEFTIVSFVVPHEPAALVLPTPTVDVLATPTVTLPPTALATQPPTPTPLPLGVVPSTEACIPGSVNITSPPRDGTAGGLVPLRGSASIPDFGFYKFEYALPNQENWQAILAGDTPVIDGDMGQWNATHLLPGLYRLRLVVTDNQGVAQPPCVINITIVPPTPSP
ncbi:MAG: hypothetical protein D6755_02085 [Anaerolineae bacterium]|nr:MAG: hypothetical protein D6755_02085 [Anaerolineae bacterium]